ncbi:hypothetical protein B5807_06793 [Epicoccum nigrum]|uniref:Uncharacterized protein n=1 Tax=Epicoccum nigrum TaxID=105696 RepID=A0A1Y2M0B3_EPING|nr:hypothetical protein B5807_06793 [Epicoccum nigrum]
MAPQEKTKNLFTTRHLSRNRMDVSAAWLYLDAPSESRLRARRQHKQALQKKVQTQQLESSLRSGDIAAYDTSVMEMLLDSEIRNAELQQTARDRLESQQDLQQRLEQLERIQPSLQLEIKKSKRSVARISRKNARLKRIIGKLVRKYSIENQDYQDTLLRFEDGHRDMEASYTNEITRLHVQLKDMKEVHRSLNSDLETEYAAFERIRHQKEEDDQEYVDEVENHKKTRAEVVNLQSHVQSLKAANKIYTKNSRRIADLEVNRESLRQQIFSAQKDLHQSERSELALEAELRELRRHLKQKTDAHDDLGKVLEQRDRVESELRRQLEAYSAELHEERLTEDDLHLQLVIQEEAFDAMNADLEQREKDVMKFEEQLAEKHEACKNLETDVEQRRFAENDLQLQLVDQKEAFDTLNAEHEQREIELGEQLADKDKACKNLKHDFEQERLDATELQYQLAASREACVTLKAEVDEGGLIVNELEDEYADLYEFFTFVSEDLEREKDALDDVEQEIVEKNRVYALLKKELEGERLAVGQFKDKIDHLVNELDKEKECAVNKRQAYDADLQQKKQYISDLEGLRGKNEDLSRELEQQKRIAGDVGQKLATKTSDHQHLKDTLEQEQKRFGRELQQKEQSVSDISQELVTKTSSHQDLERTLDQERRTSTKQLRDEVDKAEILTCNLGLARTGEFIMQNLLLRSQCALSRRRKLHESVYSGLQGRISRYQHDLDARVEESNSLKATNSRIIRSLSRHEREQSTLKESIEELRAKNLVLEESHANCDTVAVALHSKLDDVLSESAKKTEEWEVQDRGYKAKIQAIVDSRCNILTFIYQHFNVRSPNFTRDVEFGPEDLRAATDNHIFLLQATAKHRNSVVDKEAQRRVDDLQDHIDEQTAIVKLLNEAKAALEQKLENTIQQHDIRETAHIQNKHYREKASAQLIAANQDLRTKLTEAYHDQEMRTGRIRELESQIRQTEAEIEDFKAFKSTANDVVDELSRRLQVATDGFDSLKAR